MSYFYLRTKSADGVKVVISVSKKVSKKAVTRNLIKRRVRSIVREFLPDFKPATYFIIAKTGAENIKGKELENELKKLLVVSRQL